MNCLQRQLLSIFLYDQALLVGDNNIICNAGSFSNSTCNVSIEISLFDFVLNYLMIALNIVAACQRTRKARQTELSRSHPKKLPSFFAFILIGVYCTE